MPVRLKIDEAAAHRVYDILVNSCGLEEHEFGRDWTERDRFVRAALEDRWSEYRFIGALGGGGKVWNNNGKLYVNCYREDETPERLAMIEDANRDLAKLAEHLEQYDDGR